MKKFLSLCLGIVILTSVVYASDVNLENITHNTETFQADDITYAHEQEDYDELEYMRSFIMRNAIMNGDSGMSERQIIVDEELRAAKLLLLEQDNISTRNFTDEFLVRNVPVYEQINSYYCGPATTKQVSQYNNKTSDSQARYATRLGTTTSGTDMTRIPGVLNADLGLDWYMYDSIGDFNSWFSKVRASLRTFDRPAVLDINTNSIAAFPYNSSGHFVNVSGYEVIKQSNVHVVRITDPWTSGLGNKWYTAKQVYDANNAHFRKAMIW